MVNFPLTLAHIVLACMRKPPAQMYQMCQRIAQDRDPIWHMKQAVLPFRIGSLEPILRWLDSYAATLDVPVST